MQGVRLPMHLLFFFSFLQENGDVPIYVKKFLKMFNAAVMSTIFFGFESWLESNIKPIESLYNWCVNNYLENSSEVCYAELGLPLIKYLVEFLARPTTHEE